MQKYYDHFFIFHFSSKHPQIPKKPKAVLMKSTFRKTSKCHIFPTFLEISRTDVGFTDSYSVTV